MRAPQGVAQLKAWCRKLRFDVPPVPKHLGDSLRRISPHEFATRDLPWSPYMVEEWVEAAEREDVADYLVAAHAGHGVNSYAISYFLVLRNLRLFIHIGFGGVYMEAMEARQAISASFKGADELVRAASSAPPLPAGHKPMTVVATEFYGSRWRAPSGDGDFQRVEVDEGPLAAGSVLECIRRAIAWFATAQDGSH